MKLFKLVLLFSFLIVSCTPYQKSSISDENLNYIKSETVGGKLDFGKTLEHNSLFLMDGHAYNRNEAALFLWGSTVCKLGVGSAGEAVHLYETIMNNELKPNQVKALKAGFKKCGDH